ncbi:MAG: chalcone isomerase family protein [Desulfobacteraceae bacterium]
MMKHWGILIAVAGLLLGSRAVMAADSVDVLGVKFPKEKVVEGKTLILNGVAFRKALGFINVYAVGLYLETPTRDAAVAIASEQIKHLSFHYLTHRATAKKLREGFLEAFKKANPADKVARNISDAERYASWYDKDMAPGLTAETTYVPGKGLTLVYQGETRGTIANPEFINMYYVYNFGEKANAKIRDRLLGKR